MSNFDDKLSTLCSLELPRARRDPQRLADMVGALVDALCLTIAVGTAGDPRGPNELIEGISVQLHEGVAEKAPLAAFILSVA